MPLIRSLLLILFLTGAAYAEPIQIIAFGGSNTFGKGVANSDAYPAQLERLLRSAGYDVTVKNEGTNGQTTSDELEKLGSAVPDGARIVIFQPGGNDKRPGKKHFVHGDTGSNIRTIVQKLLERKILVLFSGPPSRTQFVENLNILTIDEINRLAPNDLQGDQEHLTANGYKIVAEKMLPLVRQMLDQLAMQP